MTKVRLNRKTAALIILFAGMLLSAGAGRAIASRRVQFCFVKEGMVSISIRFHSYEEIINPYYCEREDVYYYFLPSVLCGKKIYNDFNDTEFYIDNQLISKYETFEWGDGTIYHMAYAGTEIKAKFVASSDIPAVFISTDTGSMEQLNTDKSYIERGKMSVVEADGSVSYNGGLSLKGRGNSTYRYFEKKAYNIKLDKGAGILGMDKDKDWCLLANSWDYSYMNNKLAFDMASKAGFDYVPGAEYADVYFNGEYWGIYLITEKVEVDENRIDITDLKRKNEEANPGLDLYNAEKFDYGNKRGVILNNIPYDITGGYLLERDYRLSPHYEITTITTSYFETSGYGTCINVKSPEYASEEEIEYISSLTSEMEQAIVSPDGYSQAGKYYLDYIDLASWVKWYMVAEIAYDPDKDVTNTYFYKDTDTIDTRFHMEPVWDYDCRFGGTVQYSYANVLTRLREGGGWCRYLYERKEFFEEICKEWKLYFKRYLCEEAGRNIDSWKNLIDQSVSMDNVRWDRGEGYPVKWPGIDNSEEFTDKYSFDDEVNHLKNWISERCEFLDGYWGG